MSEQPQFAEQAEQQTQGGDDSAVQANNAQPETPMTREEIFKMVDERSAMQFQAIQSMQKKTEERLKSEVANRLSALQTAGVTLTPEQANKVYQETEKQFRDEAAALSQPAQVENPQSNPNNQPPRDPISQAAYEMMQEENVFIQQDDPEFSTIDTKTTSRRVFLKSVDKAIEAKKERLARPRGLPAASPSMSATGGNVGANTLEAQYNKEVSQIKRGDSNALLALKRKYREKGLPV